MEIKEQDYLDWLGHPVTQAVRQLCRLRQEELKERWASGEFTDLSQFGTAILNAKAIGNYEAYEKVRKLDYEELRGELDDE